MRIEINTEKKTFKIFDEILLEEFIKEITSMFPDGSWKKFKITFDKTFQPVFGLTDAKKIDNTGTWSSNPFLYDTTNINDLLNVEYNKSENKLKVTYTN